MKRIFLLRWAFAAVLGSAMIHCGGDGQPSRNDNPSGPGADGESLIRVVDPQLGTPSFVQYYGDSAMLIGNEKPPEDAAREVLENIADAVGIEDVSAEMDLEHVGEDTLGMTHVTFRQVSDGVRVFGMRYGVHFDRAGRLAYVSGRYVSDLHEHTLSASLDEEEAIDAARQDLEAWAAPDQLTDTLQPASASQVVYAPHGTPRLAYDVQISYAAERLVAMRYVVDANDGSILRRLPEMRHLGMVQASGAGVLYHARGDASDVKTFEVTQVGAGQYEMKRPGNGSETGFTVYDGSSMSILQPGNPPVVSSTELDEWDTGVPSAGQAVDGYAHMQMVDEFHRGVLGRASYDGAGTPMSIYVHVPEAQDNAFYYNGGVYSGDIVASAPNASYIACLDVVAHEFQHGVNRETLDLVYLSQSGAIDEGLADIFGAFVEHHHHPNEANNVVIGEASTSPHSNPIRNMEDPASQNQPDHMDGYRDLPTDDAHDLGGVHVNSTIISHAWYLMTLGGTNATSNVEVEDPLGWDESAELWNAVVEGRVQAPTMAFEDFARVMVATAYQLESASGSQASQAPPTPQIQQDGEVEEPPSAVSTVGCAWHAVGVLSEDEIEEHWGITCDGEASEGPSLDCFTGGQECTGNQLCSWNGPGNGYCCKEPWQGEQVCFTDKDCAPGICSRGADDTFYCTQPDAQACVDGTGGSSNGGAAGSGSAGAAGSSGSGGGSAGSGGSGQGDPGCDGFTGSQDPWRHASLGPSLLLLGLAGAWRRRRRSDRRA